MHFYAKERNENYEQKQEEVQNKFGHYGYISNQRQATYTRTEMTLI